MRDLENRENIKGHCTAERMRFFITTVAIFVGMSSLGLCIYLIIGNYSRLKLLFKFTTLSGDNESLSESYRTKNGLSEKEQLYHYWYNCGHDACRMIGREAFLHHIVSLSFSGSRLRIYIEEYFFFPANSTPKLPSVGGSNFRIELEGMEILVCPVRDYFNGTYLAYCPDIKASVSGKVYLDYTSFEAYVHHPDPTIIRLRTRHPGRNRKLLKTFSHAYSGDAASDSTSGITLKKCENININDYLNGRWWRFNGQWTWGTNYGCIFDFKKAEDLRKCFKGKTTFRTFGDSHVRDIGDYFNSYLVNESEKIHFRDIKDGSMYASLRPKMTWVSHHSTVYHSWAKVDLAQFFTRYNSTPATKNDVILLSIGIHSLVFKEAKELLESSLPKFVDFLATVRKEERTTNLRIIYLNVLPRAYGDQDSNDYMLAAVNQVMKEKLEKVRVEVIDGFNILNPVQDTSCDRGTHFLCAANGSLVDFLGNQGKTLAHLIFQVICDDEN